MRKRNKEINFEKVKIYKTIYYKVFDKEKHGHITLWILNNPNELFLENFYVLENYRNMGLGQKLLNYSFDAARKLGMNRIALRVVSNTWMESWYKRNGFIEGSTYEDGDKYLYKLLKHESIK